MPPQAGSLAAHSPGGLAAPQLRFNCFHVPYVRERCGDNNPKQQEAGRAPHRDSGAGGQTASQTPTRPGLQAEEELGWTPHTLPRTGWSPGRRQQGVRIRGRGAASENLEAGSFGR